MSETKNTALAAPALSKASFKPLAACRSLEEAFQTKELRDAIAASIQTTMTPDAMLRSFIQAAKTQNGLMYKADMRQVLGAMLSLSWLGLPPNTPLQYAHLIPFKSGWNPILKRKEEYIVIQVIIGYPGYIELATRSGHVSNIKGGLIYSSDQFSYEEGANKTFAHKPNIDIATEGLTPRAAYAIAYFKDGDYMPDVMSWPDVLAIRNRSQAYQTALRAKEGAERENKRLPSTWTDAPWVRDEHEMGRKTPVRRISKYLPKCPELRAGVAIEDAQDRGAILDFGPVIEGEANPMTGIPEEPEPVNPSTAFGVRGAAPAETPAPAAQAAQPARTARPAATPVPAAAEAPVAAPAAQETDAAPAPEFEGYVVSADGEVAGEPFTDPVAWARAFVTMIDEAFPGDRGAILEFNDATIADARQHAAAAQILAGVDEEPMPAGAAAEPEPPRVFLPVDPAGSDGKPDWSGWVRQIKTLLPHLAVDTFMPWLAVQQTMIGQAPVAQRMLGIKAIHARCMALGLILPDWVAALVKGAPKPAAEPPAAATTPAVDHDRKWADDTLRLIAETTTGSAFDELTRMATTQTIMVRLRREKPGLFAEMEKAFDDRFAFFHPAKATDPEEAQP